MFYSVVINVSSTASVLDGAGGLTQPSYQRLSTRGSSVFGWRNQVRVDPDISPLSKH